MNKCLCNLRLCLETIGNTILIVYYHDFIFLLQVIKFKGIKKFIFVIFHFLLITIIIAKSSFLLTMNKIMCYKITSNFTPNQERLFSIFPFVPNMFHSSSQWVPIGNLFL
jgi:hypothetical protein